MGEYQAYDDHVYDAFDAADDRHRAYRDAVRAAAPGRVVVDIGTGRDALWAIEAAHAGARHVYAIESSVAVATQAASAVERAGLGDKVTVLPGHSTEQSLPVRAELCVSEIVGNIASAEGMLPVLADARARLCTPTCAWIPFRAQTWAAAVDLSDVGLANTGLANTGLANTGLADAGLAIAPEGRPYLDRILAAAGAPFEPRLCLAGPAGEALISTRAAVESATFDAEGATLDTPEVELRIGAAATMTGVLLWARVAASSRGGREVDAVAGDTRAWAPVYVPLPAPRPVTPGDRIRLALAGTTSDDGIHPDYELALDGRPIWNSPHHPTK